MHKLIPPLIGVALSSFLVYRAATNMPQTWVNESRSKITVATSRAVTGQREQHATESPHVAVVRFLTDMDDLLDTVHDRASFAATKPKLLARARAHAALAAQHTDQGLTQLTPTAAQLWQTAANRHARSLARAMGAVSEVETFFAHDMAEILSP